MRVRWLVPAFVAGCSFPHGSAAGDASGSGDDAPMVIDAPVDMMEVPVDMMPDMEMPPADTDQDTIPDAEDNCPMDANTDQRDHDGDSHGDVCDHCPHLASATDPDGDSDGVGDACDPRPATPGDSIALFEGFYDMASIQNWSSQGGGMWAVDTANGVLEQTNATVSMTNRTLSPPITVNRAAITTSVKVISFTGGSNFSAPYVSVTAGIGQGHEYWCSLVHDGNTNSLYASANAGLGFSFPNTAWNGTFAANGVYRLDLALLGTHNECTAFEAPNTTATSQGNTGGLAGSVQVATRSASASFDYVFVVEIGN